MSHLLEAERAGRPPAVPGLLAALPRVRGRTRAQGPAHSLSPHARPRLEHERGPSQNTHSRASLHLSVFLVTFLSFCLSPSCSSLLLPKRTSSCRPRQVQGYADLVRRGLPDFVEIKGVTFTGGRRPELGMKNVPWHAEVVQFTQQICALVADEYEVRTKPLPPAAPSPPRSHSAQSWPLALHG